jgi:hypothetical protein
MSETEMIENYILWRNEKLMNPPTFSPQEWAQEIIMSEANARLNLIKDLLETEDLDPLDVANKIQSLVYDPLGELHDGQV